MRKDKKKRREGEFYKVIEERRQKERREMKRKERWEMKRGRKEKRMGDDRSLQMEDREKVDKYKE